MTASRDHDRRDRPVASVRVDRQRAAPGPARRQGRLAARADPLRAGPAAGRRRARPAGAVPVRARHRAVVAHRRARPAASTCKTFMFPGVLATSVLFTATFSAASIVWDREFGFLREMLVAPDPARLDPRRQGARRGDRGHRRRASIILALAGTVGVPYDLDDDASILVGELFLLSFALVRRRAGDRRPGAADPVDDGRDADAAPAAVVPVRRAVPAQQPAARGWRSLTLLNPVTYAVHAMRTAVFAPPRRAAGGARRSSTRRSSGSAGRSRSSSSSASSSPSGLGLLAVRHRPVRQDE